MLKEQLLVMEERVEVRVSVHAEERAKERGVFVGSILDLVEQNFEELLDLRVGEEVRLYGERSGVVAPVSIDVIEDLGDWVYVVNVHTVWRR